MVSSGHIFCFVSIVETKKTKKTFFRISIISLFFCLLFFSKFLISLTVQYFKSDESIGERSMCLLAGVLYFVVSMVILVVDENTLEIGLEQAYKSFNESASVYLEERGVSSS